MTKMRKKLALNDEKRLKMSENFTKVVKKWIWFYSQKGRLDKEIESAKSSIFELILIIDNINSS